MAFERQLQAQETISASLSTNISALSSTVKQLHGTAAVLGIRVGEVQASLNKTATSQEELQQQADTLKQQIIANSSAWVTVGALDALRKELTPNVSAAVPTDCALPERVRATIDRCAAAR